MAVKTENEIRNLLNDLYSQEEERSANAKRDLLQHGEELLAANDFEGYQTLVKQCAGIIAELGIEVEPVVRVGNTDLSSPAKAIALMQDFEVQAKEKLGEKTEFAAEVTQTRDIVEKTVSVLVKQREIMGKVMRDPASLEGFLSAIDRNNELTNQTIEIEKNKREHYKNYFIDEDHKTMLNPNNSAVRVSMYDQVVQTESQIQLLQDLKQTVELLSEKENARREFQRLYDEGDEAALENVRACERELAALKEKIAKRGEDGRETGLIQRLRDEKLPPALISKLDIDRSEDFATKSARIDEVIKDVEKERIKRYQEMAKEVIKTLNEKGVVDENCKYAGKKDQLLATCNKILGNVGRSKDKDKNGGAGYADFGEDEGEDIVTPEELEAAIKDLKGYVKFVRDEIALSTDKITEANDIITFRNETKDEITRTQERVTQARTEADEMRRTPVSEDQKRTWLDETVTLGEGDSARTVKKSDLFKAEAEAQAKSELSNKGTWFIPKIWDNVKFAFTHGFKRRQKAIAERAESLQRQKEDGYITQKREGQINAKLNEGRAAEARIAGITEISMQTRNDASLHTAAHNAAANITDAIPRTAENSDALRGTAENATARNLSDAGYDFALQQWRRGDISQAEFDRILREHLKTTAEQKARFGAPDRTKGFTNTPEYKNKPITREEPSGGEDREV